MGTEERLLALENNIEADRILVKGETISFRTGFISAKSLLKLNDVIVALKDIPMKINRDTWLLKEQNLALCLSAQSAIGEKDLHNLIESYEREAVEVLGTVLIGSNNCSVLYLKVQLDYGAFKQHLENKKIFINDLVWGHWQNGWGIKGGYHERDMGFGANFKRK